VSTKIVVVGISTDVVTASVVGASEIGVEPMPPVLAEPPHPTNNPTPKMPALNQRKSFRFIVSPYDIVWRKTKRELTENHVQT
jgi:hypothetical protein